ncbi:hypothetical protein PHYBLDRAFT_172821 [Phycomyces blakesleeanus NRRL 1555(-)]|uniref:Uncharacterized protein n=1 Tax=Phycomyces blakesleeanus (strain ATCC 8743b / DSM 1359 / FGSC 10004 / NBRC 33097 / NRRL 1555) TaxID=763407 RepID=A0A167KVH5_PHYB8|nr:hypothetical protein PHYBLDRAFT_172821 [Phycomyces blakesleeanus NRRL 1555(-)]OAD68987.1 hypothetical protein PHYBLDRAFT_172821 [Phycomyces blakesleeanus NRRL 1555(-)]|eukprot:XP_018287027.1 hypothetical protein PHYBLDRAFT_172821 [Phycomyces blakesleeanus NRRL 1555(-)]
MNKERIEYGYAFWCEQHQHERQSAKEKSCKNTTRFDEYNSFGTFYLSFYILTFYFQPLDMFIFFIKPVLVVNNSVYINVMKLDKLECSRLAVGNPCVIFNIDWLSMHFNMHIFEDGWDQLVTVFRMIPDTPQSEHHVDFRC